MYILDYSMMQQRSFKLDVNMIVSIFIKSSKIFWKSYINKMFDS